MGRFILSIFYIEEDTCAAVSQDHHPFIISQFPLFSVIAYRFQSFLLLFLSTQVKKAKNTKNTASVLWLGIDTSRHLHSFSRLYPESSFFLINRTLFRVTKNRKEWRKKKEGYKILVQIAMDDWPMFMLCIAYFLIMNESQKVSIFGEQKTSVEHGLKT